MVREWNLSYLFHFVSVAHLHERRVLSGFFSRQRLKTTTTHRGNSTKQSAFATTAGAPKATLRRVYSFTLTWVHGARCFKLSEHITTGGKLFWTKHVSFSAQGLGSHVTCAHV